MICKSKTRQETAMLLLVALILGAAYLFHLYSKRQRRQIELHHVVAKREYERAQSIAVAEVSSAKLNPAKREKIAAWDFIELKENLQKGEVSSLEVLRTYQYKALRAHAETNSVTLFIKEAERWAAEWDEKASAPDFIKPAFFGIPISLKECIPLEGYDTTRGFVQDVGKPSKSDSVLIQQIKQLGTTNTPMDRTRTPGGSSGGEAALLAADGSIIGIGGDVGGSIRIPCHFTGMAGIKVWSSNWITENDPYVPPVVWNDEMYRKGNKYRIGYYVDDGWFTPAPAIQ
ncbi:Amidase, partial [Teladorsagia circumcincta]